MNQTVTLFPVDHSSSSKPLHTLSVYVNNKPGVLMRVCQVFSRRGYNIESLVVSHGRKNNLSRMTINVDGESDKLTQIIQQINKLVDVVRCVEHDEHSVLSQELTLVKIKSSPESFLDISHAVMHVDGKIFDKTDDCVIASLTATPSIIDWALKVLSKFEITEIIRTGQVVMVRNDGDT